MTSLVNFLFITVFYTTFAYADNEYRSAVTQIINGRYCGTSATKSFAESGVNCHLRQTQQNKETKTSWEIFELSLFDEGAEFQVNKNKCLSDQLTSLNTQNELFNSWSTALAANWIRTRKTNLILDICKKENSWAIHQLSSDELRKDRKKAYQEGIKKYPKRTPLPEQWQDVCFNLNEIEKLKSIKPMFQAMVPILANQENMAALEANRDSILIETKDGFKPITDQDILNMDVSDMSKVSVKLDFESSQFKAFKKSASSNLSQIISERANFTNLLIKNKNYDGTYNLDDEDRERIYNDETIYQLLCEKDPSFCNNYAGLKKTDISKLTTAQFCVFAKYEKDSRKDFLIFVGQSYALGRLAGVLRKGTSAKQTLKDGLTLGTLLMMKEQLNRTCFAKATGTEEKISSREKARITAALNSERLKSQDLTKKIGFDVYDLEVKSPACQKLNEYQKNYIANGRGAHHMINCGLSIFTMAPWLSVSLPAISLQLAQ